MGNNGKNNGVSRGGGGGGNASSDTSGQTAADRGPRADRTTENYCIFMAEVRVEFCKLE